MKLHQYENYTLIHTYESDLQKNQNHWLTNNVETWKDTGRWIGAIHTESPNCCWTNYNSKQRWQNTYTTHRKKFYWLWAKPNKNILENSTVDHVHHGSLQWLKTVKVICSLNFSTQTTSPVNTDSFIPLQISQWWGCKISTDSTCIGFKSDRCLSYCSLEMLNGFLHFLQF